MAELIKFITPFIYHNHQFIDVLNKKWILFERNCERRPIILENDEVVYENYHKVWMEGIILLAKKDEFEII